MEKKYILTISEDGTLMYNPSESQKIMTAIGNASVIDGEVFASLLTIAISLIVSAPHSEQLQSKFNSDIETVRTRMKSDALRCPD